MCINDDEVNGVFIEISLDDMKNIIMLFYKTVNLTGAEA